MSEADKLSQSVQTTYWLIGKFSADLTNEDSVVQPPFGAKSFNWVLGHILVGRDSVMRLLDSEPILDSRETKLYETGSVMVDITTTVSLKDLLHSLDKS